jgi:hypothetical protein
MRETSEIKGNWGRIGREGGGRTSTETEKVSPEAQRRTLREIKDMPMKKTRAINGVSGRFLGVRKGKSSRQSCDVLPHTCTRVSGRITDGRKAPGHDNKDLH